MSPQPEAALIAYRVICAAEAASLESLHFELGCAEKFAAAEEERLELLGAIARDMRTTLASPQAADLGEILGPHLQLLRHLSNTIN